MAVSAVAIAAPLAEVTQDETAVAMLSKSARIVEHHTELLVFELTTRFEFSEIQSTKSGVIRFQDTNTAALLSLDSFKIPIPLQQRDGRMEAMVLRIRKSAPGVPNDHRLPRAANLAEEIAEYFGGWIAGVDEEFRNPFVGVIEQQ